MKLRIAEDLALPLEFTTQTAAIVAKRRAGKSYLSRRIAEQLFNAGQQIVIVDPKGDWWGVRSAADGKSPGLPIVMLGGERGDAPLEVSAGEVVARLVVEERVSVLLDLSLFRKRDVATFMTAFLEALYRLKAREQYRTPLMLITDEADAIAPQRPMEGEERMLGAMEDIVRRGGQRGIGCMLITQRTAVLNKNVLTQAEVLVALRTIAPQDLTAMNAWIDVHGTVEGRRDLMDSLPSLPIGEAWFWSPGWPTADGIFQRVHVLPIETFDSGATPKPGEKRREPKQLADVDLDALRRQMSESIERAAQNDPKQIRKKYETRIADLQRDLKAAQSAKQPAAIDEREIQRRIKTAVDDETRNLKQQLATRDARIAELANHAKEEMLHIVKELGVKFLPGPKQKPANVAPQSAPTKVERQPSEPRPVAERVETDGQIDAASQRIVDALAELEDIGVRPATRVQVAILSNYSTLAGGTGAKNVGTLVAAGLVAIAGAGLLELTDEGRARTNRSGESLSLSDLHDRLLRRLEDGERRIMKHLIEIWPSEAARDDVATATNYSTLSGGTGAGYVGKLVNLGLVKIPRKGFIRASELLFPDRLS
jgi:hypothetical protein